MTKFREATRKGRILSYSARKLKRSNPLDAPYFDEFPDTDELWLLSQRWKMGFLPESTTVFLYESKEQAERTMVEYPVDSEKEDEPLLAALPGDIHQKFREIISDIRMSRLVVGNGGDEDGYLAWKTTNEAGLNDGRNSSDEVCQFLGPERIAELRKEFGDNWDCVAELEFSYFNLPHSSAAHIACLRQFCYFVLQDDYLAGYHQRDLEVLLEGVEQAAERELRMRKKAGLHGGARSSAARARRREAIVEQMELLAKSNPDMATLFGETAFARVAAKKAKEEEPELWNQGMGQVEEYLGEVSRGEAGSELQRRLTELLSPRSDSETP